ncbi:hypothetical protein C8D87_11750 [Lentzea atacamensis]|uniref:ABC transporter permease n=1 Tax=Lentzea atacamensis TaxID=531938 RepID=A0ABX9DYF3_9PSEU|nr:ABC transporter permease [Lentzea atacamensis]RAS58880.1 hypothetical protein C8D87_11750 [Lentzea atacamensis]
MTSAYPMPLDELIPRVRALASETGEKPSLRGVMDRFSVGAKKARAALAVLDDTDTGDRDTEHERRLHSVPALAAAPADLDTAAPAPVTPAAPDVDASPAPTVPDTDTDTPVLPAQPQVSDQDPVIAAGQVSTAVDTPAHTVPQGRRVGWSRTRSQVRRWPIVLIALGAFVSIWGGWVELGKLTGFGEITPLPGIADGWTINSAITLPLGMEAYAALALQVWLSGRTRSDTARSFAKWSALGALVLGAGGQVAYHLMKAAGMTVAPWQITTVVSCLPVIVLGFGAALVHLMTDDPTHDTQPEEVR